MTLPESYAATPRWQQARARRAARPGSWTVTDGHAPVPTLRHSSRSNADGEPAVDALLSRLATTGGKVTVIDGDGHSKTVHFV